MRLLKAIPFFLILLYFLPIAAAADYDSRAYLNELTALIKITGNAKEGQALHTRAMESHGKKKYEDSEKLWYLAAKADPGWVEAYFNLACSTTLQGKIIVALGYVELALAMDSAKTLPWVMNDPDLAGLRTYAKYFQLVETYSAKNRASGSNATPGGSHWIAEVLGKTFTYRFRGPDYTREMEITLKPEGQMSVTGESTDSMPSRCRVTGGNWSIQNEGLRIVIYLEGRCYVDSSVYIPRSKDDFMEMFSGDHGPSNPGRYYNWGKYE